MMLPLGFLAGLTNTTLQIGIIDNDEVPSLPVGPRRRVPCRFENAGHGIGGDRCIGEGSGTLPGSDDFKELALLHCHITPFLTGNVSGVLWIA